MRDPGNEVENVVAKRWTKRGQNSVYYTSHVLRFAVITNRVCLLVTLYVSRTNFAFCTSHVQAHFYPFKRSSFLLENR